MPDTKDVRTKKDSFKERMSNKYPDRSFDEDEDLYGAGLEDYDLLESELNGYRESNQKFGDMLENNPQYASLISSFVNGRDITDTLLDILGDSMEDADSLDSLKEMARERLKKHIDKETSGKTLEKTYAENIPVSKEIVDKFVAENDLTPEQQDNILNQLASIGDNILIGKITPEMLEVIRKGLEYDEAVQTAETKGRNAKIDIEKKKKEVDAPPALGGGSASSDINSQPEPRRTKNSIFDNIGANKKGWK